MNLKVFFFAILIVLQWGTAGSQILLGADLRVSRPEKLDVEGIPNFHRVSPELYRGAQPSYLGFEYLRTLGIKTIINLRSFHSDYDNVQRLGMSYEHIYMKPWHPEKEDVVRFLKIVTDPQRAPIFLYCHHGSDRTGLMVAVYRSAVCGWTKEAALQEMVEGGYGFHTIWRNLVDFFWNLDIHFLRKEAGFMNMLPENFEPSALHSVPR